MGDYNKTQIARGILTIDHVTELVRYWQSGHHLTADGQAGPVTIASIDAALGRGELPPSRFWPLRCLPDGRRPFVTSSYWTDNKSRAEADRRHYGVDLFYQYDPRNDPEVTVGDGGASGRGGKPKWWIPPGTCAVAAAAGRVYVAGKGRTGYRVWIDHGRGVYTGYFHLSAINVGMGRDLKRGDELDAGTIVGRVGDNPAAYDAAHLHFEVYVGDLDSYPSRSVNPKLWLAGALHWEPTTSEVPQAHSPT